MEYPGRIQLEHLEDIKCNCFYDGHNPEYWQMLAHKVDGEHPASYCDLLLDGEKLERWAEARDPLPPRMTVTNGSNAMHSQMSGNLFPLHKLKDNCTFAAQAATIGNNVAEEDPGVEQEREEEAEPSDDKEVEASGEVEEADQSIEYISHFTKRKTGTASGMGAPTTFYKTAQRMIADLPRKHI